MFEGILLAGLLGLVTCPRWELCDLASDRSFFEALDSLG